ncbi:hypothetical protein MTO96_034152 [Rhipicephalus appendiculatus]
MEQSAASSTDYRRTLPRKPSRVIFASARKTSRLFKPECLETLKVRSLPSTELLFRDTCIIKGGELACYPYRNTIQVCKICQQVGHRTDVSPQPEYSVCKICGTQEPTKGHECRPRCATCGKGHVTGDRSCRKRLKPPRRYPLNKPKKIQTTENTAPGPYKSHPRWFESEDEELHFRDKRDLPKERGRAKSRSTRSSRCAVSTLREEEKEEHDSRKLVVFWFGRDPAWPSPA